MSMEFVAIISASIALAGLIITGQNGLRRELQGQRKEMQEQGNRLEKKIQEQGNRLEKKIQEQGKEIEGVKIEVAALKATRGHLLPGPGGPAPAVSRGRAPRGLRRRLTSPGNRHNVQVRLLIIGVRARNPPGCLL